MLNMPVYCTLNVLIVNMTFVSSSYLPWFEIYYKLLNTLADYLTKQQVMIPFERLLHES